MKLLISINSNVGAIDYDLWSNGSFGVPRKLLIPWMRRERFFSILRASSMFLCIKVPSRSPIAHIKPDIPIHAKNIESFLVRFWKLEIHSYIGIHKTHHADKRVWHVERNLSSTLLPLVASTVQKEQNKSISKTKRRSWH